MNDLLTASQAAARYTVRTERPITAGRIRQLCRWGELPGAEKLGRDWLVPASSIDAWNPAPAGFQPGNRMADRGRNRPRKTPSPNA